MLIDRTAGGMWRLSFCDFWLRNYIDLNDDRFVSRVTDDPNFESN